MCDFSLAEEQVHIKKSVCYTQKVTSGSIDHQLNKCHDSIKSEISNILND